MLKNYVIRRMEFFCQWVKRPQMCKASNFAILHWLSLSPLIPRACDYSSAKRFGRRPLSRYFRAKVPLQSVSQTVASKCISNAAYLSLMSDWGHTEMAVRRRDNTLIWTEGCLTQKCREVLIMKLLPTLMLLSDAPS